MRIIVDGYNFIGRDKGLRGPLEPKRRRLTERLCHYANQRGCSILLIFDGLPNDKGGTDTSEPTGAQTALVEILYSGRSRSADDLIREKAVSDATGEMTVVTSDRALRASVLALSAQVLFCGQFESLLTNAGV